VYYAVEKGVVPIQAKMVKGPPTKLNEMFVAGKLDITPISSIEFARYSDLAVIMPNMSISADGKVESILLFSKVPVTELDGLKVCLPNSSATSIALLKILFEHYFQIQVEYIVDKPNLEQMLKKADAALLIGDDALLANALKKEWDGNPLYVMDLGNTWKEFTGLKMVYALWVVHRDFIEQNSEHIEEVNDAFTLAKEYGFSNIPELVQAARQKTGLSEEVLKEYFKTIQYDLGDDEKKALITFYDYAYKSGIIDERVKLNIWGETIV